MNYYYSSVIRQKGGSQNGGNKKTNKVSMGKKYSFFIKFGVLCFLVTSVLRLALFCLVTDVFYDITK